ncbi:MAG: hypothetical protein ABJB39_03655 [Chloroflexota bacterium]
MTIAPAYTLGTPASMPVSVMTTRGSISGPTAARIVATGMGGRGVPSEVLVRNLALAAVAASAGERRTTAVSWDGRDEAGTLVPGDAYVLILEFRLDGAGAVTAGRATATLQWNP